MKKIGILTSGGDAPGMNDAIVAVTRAAAKKGMELIGFVRGYQGVLMQKSPEEDMIPLTVERELDIQGTPGTYLRTARCLEFIDPEVRREAAAKMRAQGIEALVVIGGDGSYQGAFGLHRLGFPVVGIPGTIDNDLAYTDQTLGFDSAVNSVITAVRDIRACSRAIDRMHIVECMGRHCGDISLYAAAATHAEAVVVPEHEWSVDELAERLKKQIAIGNYRSTVILAEGAWDSMVPFDLQAFEAEMKAKGVKFELDRGSVMHSDYLARILSIKCGMQTRATVLGYTQRGPVPTFRDSEFAFEAGNLAVDLLEKNVSGQAIGIRRGHVFHMDLEDALAYPRFFDKELYEMINTL